MITKRYLNAGLNGSEGYADPTAFVGFTTAYDAASNKQYERHLHAESRSHLYPAQDSLDRVREYQRGVLQQVDGVVSVQAAIGLPSTDEERTCDLDGLGNWPRTVYGNPGTLPRLLLERGA